MTMNNIVVIIVPNSGNLYFGRWAISSVMQVTNCLLHTRLIYYSHIIDTSNIYNRISLDNNIIYI